MYENILYIIFYIYKKLYYIYIYYKMYVFKTWVFGGRCDLDRVIRLCVLPAANAELRMALETVGLGLSLHLCPRCCRRGFLKRTTAQRITPIRCPTTKSWHRPWALGVIDLSGRGKESTSFGIRWKASCSVRCVFAEYAVHLADW